MKRYTAEFRGGDYDDNDWEWCVIDENMGPVGSAFIFGLTEEQAKEQAEELNKEGQEKE